MVNRPPLVAVIHAQSALLFQFRRLCDCSSANAVAQRLRGTSATPDAMLSNPEHRTVTNTPTHSDGEANRQAMFELLKRIRHELRNIVPAEFVEVTPADSVILGMYWRSVRLYDGVVVLLENNLPEEAMFLARSAFEESLKLRELGDDTSKRLGLVVTHVKKSIDERRYIFANEPEANAKLDNEESELAAFAQRSGVGRYPAFLSIRAAIERFERGPDSGLYGLGHHFVHGTDFAMNFSRQKIDTGEMLIRDRTKTLWVQLGVAIFASLSLVEATKGAAQVFGWRGVTKLADLQDEFNSIQDKVRAPGASF